ncbi:MAG TPA: TM0106 family RecB-like putative nuclease [Pyrinomonadaceae bacterium]|nr:TM0106 family RecB-like putative nuclease [Pyrinomonadaceae bacterium]
MRIIDGKAIYSPSDLVVFSRSPFASWMEHAYKAGMIAVTPGDTDEEAKFLAQMGDEHEKTVLADYQAMMSVCDLSVGDDFEERFENTKQAVQRREKILYQPALRGREFEGYADFITLGGDNVYQIWDTKLARSPRPYFIIQLCAYTEMFAETTGEAPAKKFGIILGPSGDEGKGKERVEFAFEDFRYYYENLKERFFALHNDFTGDLATRPEPEPNGEHGRWKDYVTEMMKECDHLCRVAGITRGQIETLSNAGVTTLSDLAELSDPVPNMPPATVEKLSTQARLQRATEKLREKDESVPPLFELIPRKDDATPQGLYALPKPSPKDVFFDMEGFPFNGGLEYLFGNTIHKKGGGYEFVDFWAFDRASEKKAFEEFIDWIYERWQDDPSLHIYHYANYEKHAVSNLMTRHDTREKEVDDLLRNDVFVDLYRIVKNGLYIGAESYSLKKVEYLYNVVRGENVASAVDSVLQFAKWIDSGEPRDWKESPTLRDIREYNKVDCESTALLCEWLRKVAADNNIPYRPYQTPDESLAAKPEEPEIVREKNRVITALRDRREVDKAAETLSDLINFHRREEKPSWWRFYDLAKRLPEELRDEPDCVAGLSAVGEPQPEKRSLAQRYQFDTEQECRVSSEDASVTFQEDIRTSFHLLDIDQTAGVLTLKASQDVLDKSEFGGSFPVEGSIIEKPPSLNRALQAALFSIGQAYLAGSSDGPMDTFLSRTPPREAFQKSGEDTVKAAIRIADSMDGDCLVIQGPPGTGKTYTAARLILSLIAEGKRVGIMSNSHKAIVNLMTECCVAAKESKLEINAIKVRGRADERIFIDYPSVVHRDTAAGLKDWFAHTTFSIIGGTAWLFASDKWVEGDSDDRLDFLFIDEAGQVSLANTVAASRSAKNLVLLGDQMQLEQPLQGLHPGDAGLSALQYTLKDVEESKEGALVVHAVVPDEQGLFLGVSRRMHPDVCDFISDSIYEGRLESFADCARQRIGIAKSPNSLIDKEYGIVFSAVEHDGNTQASEEEAERVLAIYNELLGREYTDRDGKTQPLGLQDFLFIAPYNAQVVHLRERLPDKARVGSVDRFQGQQAPVCILSLCSSVGEYGSRGLSFILDQNRINVAISRAQCLAVVVADPRIASDSAGSIKEMKLLNLFCRLSKQ